jgi:hypothetical protein
MTEIQPDIAFANSGRTGALVDGAVVIEGEGTKYQSARIVHDFEQIKAMFDAPERGMAYFLRALEVDLAFLARPLFPGGAFLTALLVLQGPNR